MAKAFNNVPHLNTWLAAIVRQAASDLSSRLDFAK